MALCSNSHCMFAISSEAKRLRQARPMDSVYGIGAERSCLLRHPLTTLITRLKLFDDLALRPAARAAEPDLGDLAGAVAQAAHSLAVAGVAVGERNAAAVAGR